MTNHTTCELIATASIKISGKNGPQLFARVLLDTCSTTNFMTEDLATKLNLDKKEYSVPIGTLNSLSTVSKHIVKAMIHSRITNYQRELIFLTVPHIAEAIPDQAVNRANIKISSNIKMADPQFHLPAPIDLLISSGPTLELLCIGQLKLNTDKPSDLYLQKTRLGWIIGGSASTTPSPLNYLYHSTVGFQTDISKFWELEEETTHRHLTKDEAECEKHFKEHVSRQKNGRYIVALPFNEKKELLGESRNRALHRLKALERRFNHDLNLKEKYKQVLQEYIDLNHMTKINTVSLNDEGFYLPHHAVMKESSNTTKVRVVFDGSLKTNTGVSLNDTLRIGPTIQSDLFALLIRFRLHEYIITGDIEKMYRQFSVRPEDRKYQRILWKNDEETIDTYELNTVTFGLSSAPFLAIRCLQQLAEDEGKDFPLAASILKNDMYVDDVITGALSIQEALKMRDELIQILKRGQLNVRQWASNSPELLKNLHKDSLNIHLQLGDNSPLKTLGIYWDSSDDLILYKVNINLTPHHISKRTILSETAKIFDPLGLLGPITITAKLFIQRLWTLKLEWDESLPNNIHTEWSQFYQQLQLVNNYKFNRQGPSKNSINIQLHGFCDASQGAYGACVYLRSIDKHGKIRVELLCSKSRVAPLKPTTIPRLELCGALLLIKLITNVKNAIHLKIHQVKYWTDSTIVLHWLNTAPQRLKTFVANRVTEIQTKSDVNSWSHVRTFDNPADLLSRGQTPYQFLRPSMWTKGPPWLSSEENFWPQSDIQFNKEPLEQRKITCLMNSTPNTSTTTNSLIHRFSSIRKLRNIVAYCLRFKRKEYRNKSLSSCELIQSNIKIISLVQGESFSIELQCLKKNQPLPQTSKLLKLNPFVDTNGIIRVGGRLQNSIMPFDERHPIILPKNHHVTSLVINDIHLTNLHTGIQATLYAVRRHYWPLDGRSQVWKVIKSCVTCIRHHPPAVNYLMGNLPAARVRESRPFTHTGVDYCGPFLLKQRKFRNRITSKIYVAVFICLAVKAIHLEVVSDLTSDGFIAAFRRFSARRGNCTHLYSDNATNFVGANHKLKESLSWLNNDEEKEKINQFFVTRAITWHFIPPLSPNFGGLWEAGVKSFKYHLTRVVGHDLLFTFEEFNTLTIEIEAILNSRPLTPISSDPNDPLVLTPSHFLIGDSLTNLPEQDFTNVPTNRLSVWQHIQKLKRDFWKRWHKEYLNELTQRNKWRKGQHQFTNGTVVLIREDNLPPSYWAMGRIIDIHPGEDGIVRAVTIKTATTTLKRNVQKLVPLPAQVNSEEFEENKLV